MVPPFGGDRGKIVHDKVAAVRVVEAIEDVEHRHLSLGPRLEDPPVEAVALERGEETLAQRVVLGIPDPARRRSRPSLPAA
jgi:hypothetical protein